MASAAISGQGTTFNLPNYTGVLFQLTPSSTPFLSAIGGLTGGREIHSKSWEWEKFDLRDAGQNVALEGADAPTAQERVRSTANNIVQIHQEAVEVSYSKLAAVGALSGLAIAGTANPVTDELDWQVAQMLKQMARDVNYSFIRGTYAAPTDNATVRKTRGLLSAIATNVIAAPASGAASGQLTEKLLGDALQLAFDNGGINEGETATLLVNSKLKRAITALYKKDGTFRDESRSVGGVNVTTVETDFGVLNVMVDRAMDADVLAVVSLEQCAPVFLNVPGKGHFFAEPLAKTGSADRVMLYGEVGLEYGNELTHAKITGLSAPVSAYYA